jgi:hypothetical protein
LIATWYYVASGFFEQFPKPRPAPVGALRVQFSSGEFFQQLFFEAFEGPRYLNLKLRLYSVDVRIVAKQGAMQALAC